MFNIQNVSEKEKEVPMRRFCKYLCTLLICILFLGGCTNTQGDKKEIVIWSHLTDAEIAELRILADKWSETSGYKVEIHSDKGDNRAYIEAAKRGIEPDIEFGVSHDRMEKLNSEKLLAQVPDNLIDKNKYVSSSLETVTFGNKMYGIPISIETYGLYYNKNKVKKVPETLEELISQGEELGFQYDINNFYLSFPILQANGAYIFKKQNGSYNVKDIGLNNEGAIKGYTMIRDMVRKYKLMPENIESITARNSFKNGETSFYISGSWDLEELNKSGLNYGVAAFPKYNGKQMMSFITSQVVYVSSKSDHKEKDWELVNYLINNSKGKLFDITGRIPPFKIDYNIKEVKNSEKLKTFIEQSQYGEVLPNVSEIQALQDANKIMMELTAGKITPEECGKKIEQNILDFIVKEKQK